MGLRLTTWNVNGIRNPFGYQPWRDNRTFNAMFDILESDIVVMQELKIQRKDLKDDMVLVPGWDCYFSLPKHKKGYSGVGIYTRQSACAPIRAEEGVLGVLCPPDSSTAYRDLPEEESIGGYPPYSQIVDLGVDPAALDAEGRCVVLEFPAFVLLGVYSPANSNGLRDDFRRAFLTALDTRIRNLDKLGKRVILTGDLNVSRDELDSAGAEDDRRKMGLSHEDYISTPNRRIFNQLLEGGEVVGERDEGREAPVLWDICRGFHEGRKGMYTHWEQKINARPGNYGSRIDFILCSISMKPWISASNIQEGLMGSDHCPVYAEMKERVVVGNEEVFIRDIANPPGIFRGGQRVREQSLKDLPPFSARLLPEFDRRRSIKDMFKRQPSAGTQATSSIPREMSSGDAAGDSNHSTGPPLASQQSSNGKRKPQAQSATTARKRAKPVATSPTTQKSQSSLKGFFQAKQRSTPTIAEDNGDLSSNSALQPQQFNRSQSDLQRASDGNLGKTPEDNGADASDESRLTESQSTSMTESQDEPTQAEINYLAESESVIDPIVAKEGWTKLFTKRQPPRCEGHNEPCTSFETKKKGFNCGRSFWVCARPVGPSGGKEVNTQWRCRTFIWASDWNGSS